MRGWMIVFGSMSVPGPLMSLAGSHATVSIKTLSVVFALLFLTGIVTRIIRGRAW